MGYNFNSLDSTEKFWNYLLIPKDILERRPPTRTSNSIIFRNILLFGFQGGGKTETAKGIAEKLYQTYGKRNTNTTKSEEGNLKIVLHHGFEDKLVNFVFVDDLTLRPVDKETLADYFRCRHLVSQRFGRNNGYILSCLSVHRFFSIPVELRVNINGILIKDSTMNPYDRAFLTKLIGKDNMDLLDRMEEERIYKPEIMKYSFFKCKTFSGIVNIPIASKDYLHDARSSIIVPKHNVYQSFMDMK